MAPKLHRSRGALRLGKALGVVGIIWLAGFVWFVATLPGQEPLEDGAAIDGIVVLTGGPGRVQAGLDALAKGSGGRLLISGVNPDLANETIMNAIGGDRTAEACCIDLGRQAHDTRGNAVEAAEWAQQHNFHSLLVVTADYHLPRALIEFSRKVKDVRLVAYAVEDHASILSVASEFNKYLFSIAGGLMGSEKLGRMSSAETKD